jgi:hypothetical protein
MNVTSNDAADRKLRYIRHVRRAACRLARELACFDADALWKHSTKPPHGVDPRVIDNALNGLRTGGLIERLEYHRLDTARTHGRPQSLWRAQDRAGIDEWLCRNPPGEEQQATTIQLEPPIGNYIQD